MYVSGSSITHYSIVLPVVKGSISQKVNHYCVFVSVYTTGLCEHKEKQIPWSIMLITTSTQVTPIFVSPNILICTTQHHTHVLICITQHHTHVLICTTSTILMFSFVQHSTTLTFSFVLPAPYSCSHLYNTAPHSCSHLYNTAPHSRSHLYHQHHTHVLIWSSLFCSLLWAGLTLHTILCWSSRFFFNKSRSSPCNFSYSSSHVVNTSKQADITWKKKWVIIWLMDV